MGPILSASAFISSISFCFSDDRLSISWFLSISEAVFGVIEIATSDPNLSDSVGRSIEALAVALREFGERNRNNSPRPQWCNTHVVRKLGRAVKVEREHGPVLGAFVLNNEAIVTGSNSRSYSLLITLTLPTAYVCAYDYGYDQCAEQNRKNHCGFGCLLRDFRPAAWASFRTLADGMAAFRTGIKIGRP
jgi:hypothetical protein